MQRNSEAVILRTYPLHEADLLVTFFTRAEGKLKGVAKAAKRSKKRFGGALEPLTLVRAYYEDKGERHELTRLDACDIILSPLATEVDYPRAVALGYVGEVLDQLMPDREAHDDVFRLTVAVLHHLRAGAIWMPLTYFDLWVVKLMGIMPEIEQCIECGAPLEGRAAFFHPLSDGLMCAGHRRLASPEMSVDSRTISQRMYRAPIDNFDGQPWPKQRAADLRRFLAQRMERHLERKLTTAAMLDRL